MKTHITSKREINDLKKIVEREVGDASVEAISNDRRFACSYNAALQLGHIVLAAAGYRTNTTKSGHHKSTFEATELILAAPEASRWVAHFEVCRRKRNALDYSVSGSINAGEVSDIQNAVLEFRTFVEAWLAKNYPALI